MYLYNQFILSDFRTFLDYIVQKNGLELTKDKKVLRSADLLQLNEFFYHKAQGVNNKSKQAAFTVVNTLFYIAQVSELMTIKQVKQQFFLFTNPDRVRQFDALRDEEQYFFLLESFWCYVDWDIAYDCRAFWEDKFYLKLAAKPVGVQTAIGERNLKRKGEIEAPAYPFVAEIFAAFGFLDIVWDEKLEKRPDSYTFPYQSVAITALGKIMLPLLFERRSRRYWQSLNPHYSADVEKRMEEALENMEDEFTSYKAILGIENTIPVFAGLIDDAMDEEEVNPYEEPFANAFLPAFPDLKIDKRFYPIERPFVGGQYVFKVALDKNLYRTIALDAQMTLEDLHLAIQGVYKFDNDHLYMFYMNGIPWSQGGETYTDSRGYDGEGILAGVIRIGELGLQEGKTFLYVFDFGDNWQFYILVLSMDEKAKSLKKYKLLESVGKAPKQYDFEEDEEEE